MSTLSQFFSSGSGSGYADSNFTLFTSSGSLTIPTAVKYVAMAVIGGAGAPTSTTPGIMSSGAGGGFSYWDGPVTSTGGSLTVTVGAAGTSSGPAAVPGTNGGTSSIPNATTILPGSANISATGGTTYVYATPAPGSTTVPATGGTGSNGIINSSGGNGTSGTTGALLYGAGAGGVFGPGSPLGGYSGSGGDISRSGLAAANGYTAGGFLSQVIVSGPPASQTAAGVGIGHFDNSTPGAPGYIISTTRNGRISQTKTYFAAAGGAGGNAWTSVYTTPASPAPIATYVGGDAGHGGAGGAGGIGASSPGKFVPGGNGGFGAGGGAGRMVGATPAAPGGDGGFGGSGGGVGGASKGGIASVEWWNY